MAKDGTNRGGARPGAGRKKKPLAQRIQEGMESSVMPTPVELSTAEMPDIRLYLSDEQRLGELYGNDIYQETWNWLRKWNCAHLIHPQMLEQYSMAMARYIQLERLISEYGFISKHPTTGAPITSPMVSIAHAYSRQANVLWQEIYEIVKENSAQPVNGNPQSDMMEKLLGL